MKLLKGRELFVLVVLIGCTKASSPYIADKTATNDIRAIPEDFNGTVFRILVKDDGNKVDIVGNDAFTKEYFNVIPASGSGNGVWVNVTVEKELDRETLGDHKVIRLLITDTEGNPVPYEFNVYITDINDNNPVFQNLPYNLDLPELPCNKTGVVVYKKINATDADQNQNGKVSYSMKPKAQSLESQDLYNRTFSIDARSGRVTLKTCLDYENNSYYQFTIKATDDGPNGGKSSTADLIIRIQDVQDKPPFFTGIPYRKSIKENKSTGSTIVQVNARDGDPGVSNAVNYTITKSSCGELFYVNNTTGAITTKSEIDRDKGLVSEVSGNCIITVLAKEIENHPNESQYGNTTAVTTVTIIVEDVDDNSPVFNQTTYYATVQENTPNDVPIHLNKSITVTDIDQGSNALMTISLKNFNDTPCTNFIASPPEIQGSGNIMILVNDTQFLDYEKRNSTTLKVVATGKVNKSMSSEATVQISILDKNDNNPKFNNTKFTISIEENTPNGTIISQIKATDADITPNFRTLKYSLSGGNDLFTVDKDSGDIRTSCTNCTDQLDREKRSDYYMTFFAEDGGGNRNSCEISLTLTDVNDNSPTFSRHLYTSFFKENIEAQIVKLEASDRDEKNTSNSRFTFEIINILDTGLQHNLTIDNKTGEICLKDPVDFEKLANKKGVVNVTVAVTDMGQPQLNSTSVVLITVQDVNDNPPKFTKEFYSEHVKEDQTSDANHTKNITRVNATDNDVTGPNNEISYFKTAGSENFKVDPATGMVSIRINAKLDREAKSQYNLTILAIDKGSPPQTGITTYHVNITDVNDEKPVFANQEYKASVREDTAVGTTFQTCNASDSDLDSNLVYSIITLEARDENGKLVNETLVKSYFAIRQNNGSVFVNSLLDRETAETITLQIQVNDTNGFLNIPQTDTANLTITITDVNDNTPTFTNSEYTLKVAEDAGNGRKYDGPIATDKDINRTITYTLIQGPSPLSSFQIEKSTGILVKNGTLDRETNSSFVLQIIANDNGVPSFSSTINVNVTVLDANDNPPVFSNGSRDIGRMHMSENTEIHYELVHINATDADGGPNNNKITYGLVEKEYFKINASTGIIYVSKSPDREVASQIKLTITAKDNPLQTKTRKTSSMTLIVCIDDENDNNPIFANNYTQHVEEDKVVGSPIIQVLATDKDEGNNSKITYEIDESHNKKFSIDPSTGEIKVNSSLLDCVGNYSLTVFAYDHGSPQRNGSTIVNITVTDKNRHEPVIGNLNGQEIKIYECAKLNTLIHTFNYTDDDFGENAKASFNISILQDDVTEVFNLTQDGRLLVIGKLNVNQKPSYKFGIMATDHGAPPLSSEVVKFTVIIMDVNDHLPSFKSTKVTWSVKENATYTDSILKVTAFDQDPEAKACYHIAEKWKYHFNVNRTNGMISILEKLDHEENTTVSFNVTVNDCSINKNVSAYCDKNDNNEIDKVKEKTNDTIEVMIVVIDIDDSPPVFKQKQLATGMRRNTEADTELELRLRNETYISDADSPQNGVLSWAFSNYGNVTISPNLQDRIKANSGARPCGDNVNHIFCVTTNGTIVNNKFFSEDLSGYFILTIKVADNGGYDTANITIYLISDSQVVTMTIRNNKGVVAQFKDDLLQSLSGILGYTAIFDSLQDHKENGDINPQSSDLSFHIVEKESMAVLSGKEAIAIFDKQASNDQMIGLQNKYNVINVAQKNMEGADEETSSRKLTFILLAVSIAEALIISTIIFVALSARNKFRRKLKAAVINTPDMEMRALEQKEVAIPGSNQYSKLNNPLLNAKVNQASVDNESIASAEDVNLDENDVDDPSTVYDKMEEREVTLDMYTEDTAQNISSEDLLGAALHHHAMRKSKESLDQLDDDNDVINYPQNTSASFLNETFTDDYETTEI